MSQLFKRNGVWKTFEQINAEKGIPTEQSETPIEEEVLPVEEEIVEVLEETPVEKPKKKTKKAK
jgi:hypothetical protein